MTIPYSLRVATCRGIGNFYRLLAWWPGSVYRMMVTNMFWFAVSYFCINIFYRFILAEFEELEFYEMWFREIVFFFRENNFRIPLVFVLSFFVTIVNERWWAQVFGIPWPDPLCLQFSVLIHGQDRRGRMYRRTLARYINLALIFTFDTLSEHVRLRFPSLKAYCEAGLLTPQEVEIIERLDMYKDMSFYQVPIIWAVNLIDRAHSEGRIYSDIAYTNLIKIVNEYSNKLLEMLNYEKVFVPLSYTQVSTLAVHVYFFIALIGNQFVYDSRDVDMYIPYIAFLEYFFFVGWLKIAEAMLNPYGSDDDDFELNWIIDRNLQVSYLMVDEVHRAHPSFSRDFYFEKVLRRPYYIVSQNIDGSYSNDVYSTTESKEKDKVSEAPEEEKAESQVDEKGIYEGREEDYTPDVLKDISLFENLLTKTAENVSNNEEEVPDSASVHSVHSQQSIMSIHKDEEGDENS